MLTSVLVFLLYPARKGAPTDRPSIVDLVLVALTVVSIGYWIDQYVSYAMFRVSSPNQTDLIMGGIAILIMLETSRRALGPIIRSEEHTSELQSLMRISYAVFCL